MNNSHGHSFIHILCQLPFSQMPLFTNLTKEAIHQLVNKETLLMRAVLQWSSGRISYFEVRDPNLRLDFFFIPRKIIF